MTADFHLQHGKPGPTLARFGSPSKAANTILAETDKKLKPSGFLWDSYAVYFIELRESGFIEPFSRHILQGGANEGIARWLERHADRVRSFLQWSGKRRWDLGKYRHGSKHRRPKQA